MSAWEVHGEERGRKYQGVAYISPQFKKDNRADSAKERETFASVGNTKRIAMVRGTIVVQHKADERKQTS
jgi:hypothetical protein